MAHVGWERFLTRRMRATRRRRENGEVGIDGTGNERGWWSGSDDFSVNDEVLWFSFHGLLTR